MDEHHEGESEAGEWQPPNRLMPRFRNVISLGSVSIIISFAVSSIGMAYYVGKATSDIQHQWEREKEDRLAAEQRLQTGIDNATTARIAAEANLQLALQGSVRELSTKFDGAQQLEGQSLKSLEIALQRLDARVDELVRASNPARRP